MISLLVAGIALIGNALNTVGVLVSIETSFHVWPPGERDWRYWFTWVCWYPATAGFFLTGILDWGSAGIIPNSLRLLGGIAGLVGAALAIVAIRGLGTAETTGVEGELQTECLYKYSRNPQYVGDIVMTVGWVAISDSQLAAIVGVTYAFYYVLLPFAEEPWLYKEYGEVYAEYRQDVPRYIGIATLRRLWRDL